MIAIPLEQINPPAIVCQLTDQQQAAAYRDRIRQQSDAWAEQQLGAAQRQAQAMREANSGKKPGKKGKR